MKFPENTRKRSKTFIFKVIYVQVVKRVLLPFSYLYVKYLYIKGASSLRQLPLQQRLLHGVGSRGSLLRRDCMQTPEWGAPFPPHIPTIFPVFLPCHSRAKNEKCGLNEKEKDSELFNKTTVSLIGKRGQTPGLPMTPVQCPGMCPETHEGIQCSVQSHRFINDYHREFDTLKWICLWLCFILIEVLLKVLS